MNMYNENQFVTKFSMDCQRMFMWRRDFYQSQILVFAKKTKKNKKQLTNWKQQK